MKLEDRLKEVNNSNYIDSKNITDEDVQQLVDQFNAGNIMQPANTLSDWLSQKLYGHDVRNSLAFWTVIMATIADLMRTDETTFKRLLGNRQDQVEDRQTNVEQDFKTDQLTINTAQTNTNEEITTNIADLTSRIKMLEQGGNTSGE